MRQYLFNDLKFVSLIIKTKTMKQIITTLNSKIPWTNRYSRYLKIGGYTLLLSILFNIGSAKAGCQADFNTHIDSTCNGIAYFDDQSTAFGNITNWSWDFGDGNNSLEENPTHLYTLTGYYGVTLTILTDDSCSSSLHDTIYICNDDTSGGSSCNINAYFTNSVFGSTVNFMNESSGGADVYSWSFGDGNNSNATNPSHTYASTGNYYVVLSAEDTDKDSCYDSYSKYVYVNVGDSGCNVEANFSYNINGHTVSFTNLSTGNFDYTEWGFGDGTHDYINSNPVHTYNSSGTYNVYLYLWDSLTNCSDTLYQTIVISDSGSQNCQLEVEYDYTVFDSAGTFYVCFTSQVSGGSGCYYTWNFGDGNYSYSSHPCHVYSEPGKYEVCISIADCNDSSCFDTYCDIIYVGDSMPTGPGKIKGKVKDENGSGKSQEVGLSNIRVELYDGNDELFDIKYTDTEGNYEFNNLPFDSYKVRPVIDGKSTHDAVITLNEENESVDNIDFKVDENTISVTGIEEASNLVSKLSLYPNPASDRISISFESLETTEASISIINHFGQEVMVQTIDITNGANQANIQLENLSDGVYFATIMINGQIEKVHQFVKH